MKHYIYLITNIINGKKYVGQAVRPNKRFKDHLRDSSYKEYPLYRAIRKYGKENFEFVILEDWNTQEEIDDAEAWWIKILGTTEEEFGYNICFGGNSHLKPMSVRKKISEAHKKRFQDNPSLREQRSKINKGRVFSEEARQNMSKGGMGKKVPPFTDEHKQKMSESIKKSWETRNKVLGPRTEEVKEKIRNSLRITLERKKALKDNPQ